MGLLEMYAKRNWQENPYTWAEIRDIILAQYQRAGIDPTFAFKSGELPTDGSALKDKLPDVVFGNIVDGIPGYELSTTGTLENRNTARATLQATQTSMKSDTGVVSQYSRGATLAIAGTIYSPYSADTSGSWTTTERDITLAGGGAADEALYSPAATKKYHIYRIVVSSNLPGAAGGQNYELWFHEETTGQNHGHYCFNSLNQPAVIYPIPNGAVGSTANKDLLLDILGGDGVEHIYVQTTGTEF